MARTMTREERATKTDHRAEMKARQIERAAQLARACEGDDLAALVGETDHGQ